MKHYSLALAAAGLALGGCRDHPAAPGGEAPTLAQVQAAASATCIVSPSGTQWSILLEWNRVPTKEILLIRETIPGPQPHTEILPRQKRRGSITITLGFSPTAAFFVDRKEAFIRATCSSAP